VFVYILIFSFLRPVLWHNLLLVHGKFHGQDEPVARILELCILHIAMAEMASKGTPHKVVINEVLIFSIFISFSIF
jgi:hypothetical protein